MIVKLSEVESASELSSTYLASLKRALLKCDNFAKYKKLLEKFFELKKLPDYFIKFLSTFNENIVIELSTDEKLKLFAVSGNPDEVSKIVREIYSNIISYSSEFAIIFESFLLKIFPPIFSSSDDAANLGARIVKVYNEEIASLTTQEKQLFDFFHKAPYFLGINMKSITLEDLNKFLKNYDFDASLFREVNKIIINSFIKREDVHILKLLESVEIKDYSDLYNFPFEQFLPFSEETQEKFAKLISKKAKQNEHFLREKDKELDILSIKVRAETRNIIEKSLQELKDVLDIGLKGDISKAIDGTHDAILNLMKRIKFHVRLYRGYTSKMLEVGRSIQENKELQDMTKEKLKAFLPKGSDWEIEDIVLNYWKSDKYFEIIEPSVLKSIQKLFLKELKKEPEKFKNIVDKTKKSINIDPVKVIKNYREIFDNILEPLTIYKIISDMIYVWPPRVESQNPKTLLEAKDAVHLVGIELLPSGRFHRFSKSGKITPRVSVDMIEKSKKIGNILTKNFSSLISVLIYDIRGSTFMAHRLRNAEEQRKIMNKFNHVVLDAAKKGGGFLLKELGDGGIIWFGGNTNQLYTDIYKTFLLKEDFYIRSSTAVEDEFSILKEPLAGLKALRTAIGIVEAAEEFVKENYVNYRDWFGEIVEKELLHEGVTYALLPPELKSLFKLGVGIVSGIPQKDIVFTPNSFGDPDITGFLVHEASIFSSGKSQERSVILIDHSTLVNIILNIEKFSLFKDFDSKTNEKEISDKLFYILKTRDDEREYYIDGCRIKRAGIYYIDEMDKRKQLVINPSNYEFEINDNGDFVTEKGRIKLVYQVILEEKKDET